MNLSLYNLTSLHKNAYDLLEDEEFLNASEDEQTEALRIMCDNETEFIAKAGRYIELVKSFNSQEKAIKDEINSMKARAESAKKNAERLKRALLYSMDVIGMKKLETATGAARLQKKPSGLEIEEEGRIPEQFRKATIEFGPGVLEIETLWDLQARYGDKLSLSEAVAKKELNEWYKKTGEVVAGTSIKPESKTIIIN